MPRRVEVTITVGLNIPAKAKLKERAWVLGRAEALANMMAASEASADLDYVHVGDAMERSYKADEPAAPDQAALGFETVPAAAQGDDDGEFGDLDAETLEGGA
jgi:hypothetical protein